MRFGRSGFGKRVVLVLLIGTAILLTAGDACGAGKRVTVSDKMVPISDVLRQIADQAGVQLIMTSGVVGTVPLVDIKNLPWDEAMKQIVSEAKLRIWLEGDSAVVSRKDLGLQPDLSAVPLPSPDKKITLNYESTPLPDVLEKISSEVGISIFVPPGRGEDLIATKLPARRRLSINIRNVHWRRALEMVARSAGCRVEAVADTVYVVRSLDIVLKASNRSIQEVIRDIANQSGINVVLSPKVKGSITVNFDGVAWAEALDAIVTSLGLSWHRHSENTIMITGEVRDLSKVVGFHDVKYLTGDMVQSALEGIDPDGEYNLTGLQPPWVLVLNVEPHVLRDMERFLERYDNPALANPVQYDLSQMKMRVETQEGSLVYDTKLPDMKKLLFYREFQRAVIPVLSAQGKTSFLPVVDKIVVVDIPRHLAYIQQIVADKFPPLERMDSGRELFRKEYAISATSIKDMAKVVRAQMGPRILVEAGGNALVVEATLREHRRVQEILQAYDTEVSRREYNILYTPIDSLAPLLKSRLSPLAILETDPLTNTLMVEGPVPDHEYTVRFLRTQDVPADNAMSVKVFKLNFAKAKNLAATLEEFLQRTSDLLASTQSIVQTDPGGGEVPMGVIEESDTGSAGPGNAASMTRAIEAVVIADEPTNSLIVTARGSDMPKIQNLIETLDREPAQVLIIGRIIETTVFDLTDIGLGINLAMSISGATVPTTFPFEKRQTRIYDEIIPDKNPSTEGITSSEVFPPGRLFAYADPGDFQGYGTLTFSQLSATLSLLDDSRDTNLISSPRLVILDNTTATFLVSESIEYRKRGTVTQGDGGQLAFSYEYGKAEDKIEIEVTPQITPNGKILMSLKPVVTTFIDFDIIANPDGTTDKLPIQVTRSVETKVIIEDGMTLVLAGLMKNWKRSATTQVPGLGRIPLIGRLFRREVKEVANRNLLFFFTPIIMRGDGTHERKIAEVRSAYEKLEKAEKEEIIEWQDRPVVKPKETTKKATRTFLRRKKSSGEPDIGRKQRSGRR